jgi:hypothetical protein
MKIHRGPRITKSYANYVVNNLTVRWQSAPTAQTGLDLKTAQKSIMRKVRACLLFCWALQWSFRIRSDLSDRFIVSSHCMREYSSISCISAGMSTC